MPDLIPTLLFPSKIHQSGTSMRLFFTFTFIVMIMMIMMVIVMMMIMIIEDALLEQPPHPPTGH